MKTEMKEKILKRSKQWSQFLTLLFLLLLVYLVYRNNIFLMPMNKNEFIMLLIVVSVLIMSYPISLRLIKDWLERKIKKTILKIWCKEIKDKQTETENYLSCELTTEEALLLSNKIEICKLKIAIFDELLLITH